VVSPPPRSSQILHAEYINVIRYGADNHMYTVVGSWTPGKPSLARPLGSRWPVDEPHTVMELVLRTGGPGRISFNPDDL
jgi:hypothetical protein